MNIEPDKWMKWKILIGMFFLFLSASVVSAWSINALSTHYTDAKINPIERDIDFIIERIRIINDIVIDNNADIREIITILDKRNR